MLGIKFDAISEADLQNLIVNAVPESTTLEFKRELPTWDSSSKHEFLADVSAMANHHGGYILYGIKESADGFAAEFSPQNINPDSDCLRMIDILVSNLEPKLSGCKARAIQLTGGGNVVVLSIPESWSKPHRVKTNNHFFIREGARKRQLEIPEIKMAFLNSENPKRKITDFRAERIGKIISGDAPVTIAEGIVQILHVVPVQALLNDLSLDVAAINESRIPVMSSMHGLNSRINLDGVVKHRVLTEKGSGAYTQFFRNGYVEAVRVFQKNIESGQFLLPSTLYEKEAISFLSELKRSFAALEVEGPIVILYTLLNVKGATLGVANAHWLDEGPGIFDRQQILLPDVLVENLETDEGAILRPVFDLVWNAAGYKQSLNYDKQTGIWTPHQ
ncbi:MAG: ATP-binding protein [Chlorobium sp.]